METKPFLKWAGGKTQLLPYLLPLTPPSIATYHEPFLGGGALFFALAVGAFGRRVEQAVLNDLNSVLVTTFATVRDTPNAVMHRLRSLQEDYLRLGQRERERYYYNVRRRAPQDRFGVAARMIFLNKTCFNGLYRTNRRGLFNVPHGKYENPSILDPVTIRAASMALRGISVRWGDFERATDTVNAGDFVYFDPPFHPLSRTSNFTTYTSRDFGRREQVRLRHLADRLHERGANVMVSNSSHPWIRELWDSPRYSVEELPARRVINSRGDRRGVVGELVIRSYR